MKKLIAAALTLVMMAAPAFTTPAAAAEAEDLTGIWYLQSMQEQDQTYDASLLAMMGMTATMELNEDGTVVLTFGDDTASGTWTNENGAGVITLQDESEEEPSDTAWTLVDGEIVVGIEEGSSMTFGREMVEAASIEVGAVVEAPELADFNGTWKAVGAYFFGMTLPLEALGEDYTLTIQDGAIEYYHLAPDYSYSEEEEEAEVEDIEGWANEAEEAEDADYAEEEETAEIEDIEGWAEEAEGEEVEEEPALIEEKESLQAELADGALVVANGGEKGTINLSLKLHDNGYLTDGYTDPEPEETTTEDGEEESFDMRYYIIYERVE